MKVFVTKHHLQTVIAIGNSDRKMISPNVHFNNAYQKRPEAKGAYCFPFNAVSYHEFRINIPFKDQQYKNDQ